MSFYMHINLGLTRCKVVKKWWSCLLKPNLDIWNTDLLCFFFLYEKFMKALWNHRVFVLLYQWFMKPLEELKPRNKAPSGSTRCYHNWDTAFVYRQFWQAQTICYWWLLMRSEGANEFHGFVNTFEEIDISLSLMSILTFHPLLNSVQIPQYCRN